MPRLALSLAHRLLGLLAGLALACSSDPEPGAGGTDGGSACMDIIDACHPKDDGTDPEISACHGLAHDDSPDCANQLEHCLEVCNAAPELTTDDSTGDDTAGTGDATSDTTGGTTGSATTSTTDDTAGTTGDGTTGDGTTGDGSTSGATTGDTTAGGSTGGGVSAECISFCECMDESCADMDNYPFADADACHTFCEGLSDAEAACFPMWCEEVENNPGIAQHMCEHAWGELGLNEC